MCVRAMIDYLYANECTIDKFETLSRLSTVKELVNAEVLSCYDLFQASETDIYEGEQKNCDGHPEDKEHTCAQRTCYLRPFGFTISMFTMGEKYDAPGLKTYSCERLEYLLGLQKVRTWPEYIAIWDLAYQHSRPPDELRKVLVENICKCLYNKRRYPLQQSAEFSDFIDRSPELAVALFKDTFERAFI